MKIATVSTQIEEKYARTLQLPLLVRAQCIFLLFCLSSGPFTKPRRGIPTSYHIFSCLGAYDTEPRVLPTLFFHLVHRHTISISKPRILGNCADLFPRVMVGSCRITSIFSETSRNLDMRLSLDNFSISTYVLEISSSRCPSLGYFPSHLDPCPR